MPSHQHRNMQAQPRAASAANTATQQPAGWGNAARMQRLPRPIAPSGSLDYYADRHKDFADRAAGSAPPDYYLGYGDRYVRRFSEQVYPLLSQVGQRWLVDVRVGLQVAIEDERAADPAAFAALESDGPAFRRFAFDTHPQAYWDAGLDALPVADLLTIGLTPDTQDLLSFEGVVQVSDIGLRLAQAWGADALDLIAGEGTASWAVQTLAAGVLATREGVDALFGAGTADGLDTAVAAVGADLESLAAGVHGVVAGGVAGAAGLVDGVAGQGATASAANGLRQQAQLGVESIESAGEWAAGVWRTLTGGAEAVEAGGGGARA